MEHFEEKKEMASDMDTALFFVKHIEAPCEDLHGNTIRGFYLREANRMLPTMKDEEAKEMLLSIIQKYEKK